MSTNKEIFFNHVAQTNPTPFGIEVEKADGLYIWDTNGKKYLDLISGVGVSNIGHRHPKVVKAIKEQVDAYMHTMVYGEYIQQPQIALAQKLIEILPKQLNNIYFVNSGTEANEGALKLAKRYTGRKEIIAFNKSYHGSTHGSLSVSGNKTKQSAFLPLLPQVTFIDFNVADQLNKITENTACVIMETIQGDAGVRIPDKTYMKALRSKCDKTGTLLILDEIQCGYGRCGSLFAFEQFGIVPDILTIAKGMGGGMPIGAFISSKEIMQSLTHDPVLGHITTFGGHPVNCAAAKATLDVIKEEINFKEVNRLGALMKSLLVSHPLIKEIRQIGFLFAIDMASADVVNKVVQSCLKKGLITFWFLSCPSSFRIAPPLTISENEIRSSAELILESLNEIG